MQFCYWSVVLAIGGIFAIMLILWFSIICCDAKKCFDSIRENW